MLALANKRTMNYYTIVQLPVYSSNIFPQNGDGMRDLHDNKTPQDIWM